MKFASDAGAADDDLLRIKGTDIEGLSAAEVNTALGLTNAGNATVKQIVTQSAFLEKNNNLGVHY